MLKVSYIATTLEITFQQVHNYIKKKQLKATKCDGHWLIKEEDFNFFFNTHFINRHNKKGVKIPSNEQIQILKDFVGDYDNDNLLPKYFQKKYKNIDSLIPPLKNFYIAKRNTFILKDKSTMTIVDLSEKYNLSISQINRIIKKSKERDN